MKTEDAVSTNQSVQAQKILQIAAAVPLERSAVPDVVKKSQEDAGFSPEASAIPVEVEEKRDVENELLAHVPRAKPSSEGTGNNKTANKPEAGICSYT